jgi:hypothetical protein
MFVFPNLATHAMREVPNTKCRDGGFGFGGSTSKTLQLSKLAGTAGWQQSLREKETAWLFTLLVSESNTIWKFHIHMENCFLSP